MPPHIAVIIPFYQRQSGILKKAVLSAIAQKFSDHSRPPQLDIIVVDDSSPVPASGELRDIDFPGHCKLTIISQQNTGPAGARNNALDHVHKDTEFVAFLDSDDQWTEEHLDNALQAMGKDMDFYFSDFYQLNQKTSAFNRAKRIDVKAHKSLRDCDYLHLYEGDMFDQILTGNVIGTSTVVFRFSRTPELRFRENFVNAGEDYLFWLDFVTKDQKIVFSSKCEAVYGPGVNIFSGAVWGSEQSLDRIFFETR